MTATPIDPDELMAPGDIAELFQVSRQAVFQWKDDPNFPDPVTSVSGRKTPLYLRSEVIDWYHARRDTRYDLPEGTVSIPTLPNPIER